MPHVLVWDQNTCDNAYLTHVHHVICCVAQETVIKETILWHYIFSHLDDRCLYYVVYDNLCLSTFLIDNF